MEKINIGSVSLGDVPRVVAIIDTFHDIGKIDDLRKLGVDLLEFRFDLLGTNIKSLCEFAGVVRKQTGFSCIGTLRETPENKDMRLDIFKEIVPYCDAVDIEIDAAISRQVIAYAKQECGKVIIVSEHDFKKTPATDQLKVLVDKSVSLGADIVKIATMANNASDVTRLMNFTAVSSQNLVTIAMGDIGKVSRVLAPLFGSLFTYGYISGSVAPGQLSVEKLMEEMKLYYPEYLKIKQ